MKKGNVSERIFKLNINRKIIVFTYMLDSYFLWHFHLGHVHVRKFGEMVNLNMIPKYTKDVKYKYKICMQTKIIRKYIFFWSR